MFFVDPIEKCIDWQLRSRFPDQVMEAAKKDLPGPMITVTLPGGEQKYTVDIRRPSATFRPADVEDHMIEALDAKYSHIYDRNYQILEYLALGYTQVEVGLMFNISQPRVNKILKKLRRRL